MTTTSQSGAGEWSADVWGALNQRAPDALSGRVQLLEAMATAPGYQEARRALLHDLGLTPGASVLEAGCGTGAALPDLLELLGPDAHVVGIDPTVAFIEVARRRAARLGAAHVEYDVGDMRALHFSDPEFDAAFCDKVLIHVGPTNVALGEMVRVTRPGGRVGALEHQAFHRMFTTTRPDLLDRLNDAYRQTTYDYWASVNLARHFHEAGLVDVRTGAFLAHARSLDEHPLWRRTLNGQVQEAVTTGRFTPEEGRAFAADLEELNARGEFNLWLVIQTAVGTKPA